MFSEHYLQQIQDCFPVVYPTSTLPALGVRPLKSGLDRLFKLKERDDLKITLKLSEGDLMLLDNTRIMHARTAFSKKGKRHLQGAYTDLDGLYSQLNALENRQQNG